jgi:Oxidoreductase family, C-terminal alpha/beta domain
VARGTRIVAATEKAGVMLAVGHVMRYTPYTRAVKEIVEDGQLGDIMSVQHLEPVGFWHQAHSYVRGNWRRADLAATMLMAKSCHDLDWLQYILGRTPLRVASFGSLTQFTAANRPAGAADRCVDCSVEASCPYSAPRLYRDLLERGEHRWPLSVVIEDFSPGALDEALRHGRRPDLGRRPGDGPPVVSGEPAGGANGHSRSAATMIRAMVATASVG